MKQRSKLSLTQAVGAKKKPPPAFVQEAANDTEAALDDVAVEAPRTSGCGEPNAAGRSLGWQIAGVDTKKLIKYLTVVAAGVLSIYLLKRRFM